MAHPRILCYHSNNVNGNSYQDNDHLALTEDLELLRSAGVAILPLSTVVNDWLAGYSYDDPVVALTCDDGSWFDWHDLEHPTLGRQPSFRQIIEHERVFQPDLQMTSFVIASPEDRCRLDQTCLAGLGWWEDDWWAAAEASGVIAIENHSWDHHHDTLAPLESFPEVKRGSFREISSRAISDYQIRQAQRYLNGFRRNRPGLFAYPYGESNDYLTDEYFPRFGADIGIAAAFTTEPVPITRQSHRWKLPRYVCGWHWKSPEDLLRVLRD